MAVKKSTTTEAPEGVEVLVKKKAPAKKKTATTKTAAAKKTTTKTTAKKTSTTKKATTSRSTASKSSAIIGSALGKSLVIVESPAKAKTLQKYLGKDFKIDASVGHVKDLPASKFGVDIENNFKPDYVILKGKEKVIEKIRKYASEADKVYLAPDPDREGEAIAWHIASELEDLNISDKIFRATFNEITAKAVREALEHPSHINKDLFEAQQARRILDRLVGYKISPLLWSKVTFGLSAGRVQSVAVRLVVERQREINAFVPEEYWSLEADVEAENPPPFAMRLTQAFGDKPNFSTIEGIQKVYAELGVTAGEPKELESRGKSDQTRLLLPGKVNTSWTVQSVEKKDVKRHPAPPFITSTLQQEASRKLGYGAKRTMQIAQKLYEGMDLGDMGHTGLITYMRTDSTRISSDAINSVRNYIGKQYGEKFLPEKPNFFRTKKDAQDAHECVRPTDMLLTPEFVARFLEPEFLKLYTIIWNRFVASQMADAIFEQTKVTAEPKTGFTFTVTGLVQRFPGYLAVYEEGKDDVEEEDNGSLPAMEVGDSLAVKGLRGLQHFTQPPPRYSEATLVKELEKRGIGRPSTYATIVSVIQEKHYAEKDDAKKFYPTELGFIVTDLLVDNFPEVLDSNFTAQMEERLDKVAEGSEEWLHLISEFYSGFKARLEAASKNMKSVKKEETPTDIECDKCHQATMVIKFGRNGRFLACPRYPECKNTKEYVTNESGTVKAVEEIETDEKCPNCGRNMVMKSGRNGRFLACPGYPECKSVSSVKTGVKCPECKTGDLVERTSKRGKLFFSCSNYPNCSHVEWNRPVPMQCPQCNNPWMSIKEGKKRLVLCPIKDCGYKQELPPEKEDEE